MIYFIQGKVTKNVKIGLSSEKTFISRFHTLQASSSEPLVCLKTMWGEKGDEYKMQLRYKRLWSHAEWFRPGRRLLKFISSLPNTEFSGHTQNIRPPWLANRGNLGKTLCLEHRKRIAIGVASAKRKHVSNLLQ